MIAQDCLRIHPGTVFKYNVAIDLICPSVLPSGKISFFSYDRSNDASTVKLPYRHLFFPVITLRCLASNDFTSIWLLWILRYFQTHLCSSTEALCNQMLEPEAEGGGGVSKLSSSSQSFQPSLRADIDRQ